MPSFHEFLGDRLGTGGFSTEDTLASILPLIRQVVETHRAGYVAPLEGTGYLSVEGGQIWFEHAKRCPPRDNAQRLLDFAPPLGPAVEVVGAVDATQNLDTGNRREQDLNLGLRGQPLVRPVYLPGYVSWEHEIDHLDGVLYIDY